MSVAQEFAWRGACTVPVMEGFDPINDDRMITLRTLHATPFAARKIVRNFAGPVGLDIESLQIVDDNVSRITFAQHSAIAETSGMGRQPGHAVVRFFQRELLLITHQPAQEVGGEGAAGEELGMCPTVGYPRESIRRCGEDLAHEIRVETSIGAQELSLEI